MFFLECPVTQPLALSRATVLAIFVGAVVYTAFITTINVVAVGCELVPISSNDYNASYTLWYQKLFPVSRLSIHHQSRTDLDCPCMQYF